MKKPARYKGYSNPEAHRAEIQRSLSNAAGIHADKRQKRSRTRLVARNRAIADSI